MSYKHLLVAVDLTKSSEIVINKAVLLAKEANAKLSFIYVDKNYVSLYGSFGADIDDEGDGGKEQQQLQKQLHTLVAELDYPVEHELVVMGDMEMKLSDAVNRLNADLLVCGHHHDFWSRVLTSLRKLADTVSIDLLIVYLEK